MIEIPRKAGDFGKRERGVYKVRLLGLGGAGLNILSRVASEGGDAKLMTVLDTDIRALKSSRAAVRLQLGSEVTHGMGCGGDPDLGRESAEMSESQIREMLRGNDLVFLCVGLGGGTGSGAAPLIARIAEEEQCFVIAAVTMPFHFEGRRRQQQALDSLTDLRRFAGALLTFENDRMGDLIVPSSGVQEAFAAADRMISQSVRAITVLLDRPGMIRVTLDDLLGFLNGKDAKCTFGFGEAEGANRAERATTEALSHHLKEQPVGLAEASSVLIHLAGDNSVTFAEVEQVAAAVAEKTHPDCKVLLGVSASQELEKKLSVAIIASVDQGRRQPRMEEEVDAQDLQVTPLVPLVDLPPLVRPSPPVQSHAPASAQAPLPSRAPAPSVGPKGGGGGLPAPEPRTDVRESPALSSMDFAALHAPASPPPGSGPVYAGQPSHLPASPLPPPLAHKPGLSQPPYLPPLPPAGPGGSLPGMMPYATPPGRERAGMPELPPLTSAPGEPLPMTMPVPLPAAAPAPADSGYRSGPVPVVPSRASAPPVGNQAPEAPLPARAPGSLGDPLDYPLTGKGRFEGTEPTKTGGVDLDWPTFLRKKRASQG